MALYKPIISWFGTTSYYVKLQQLIQLNLPTQPISYRIGNTDHDVHMQCEFVNYSESDLPQTVEAASVIGRPLVHIFMIAENISGPVSKACGQRLEAWLRALERRCITDWMVLVIGEDCAGKPRSKVKPVLADKIKADYCRQNPDRVVVLYDPFRLEDNLVKDSWSQLLYTLGQLIKTSYQKLIAAYENHIEILRRNCRERRCNYFEFFNYQEELAAVYESLSLFEEALDQYQQLEALFDELVTDFCVKGCSMPWLVNFVSLEFSRIDPLGIVHYSDPEKRAHVRAQMANLFEFKLYLFSRKCCYCSLMQAFDRIPSQAMQFLFGTLHQAKLLKLDVPDLQVNAWVLLCCLQVRHIVQRYSHILNSGPMADVCHLASRKLLSLGELCGLTAERRSSEHNQRMLQLRAITAGSVAGEQLISGDSADQKMADWLSSEAAFRDAYHELIDFSIGIYKHQGRTRFAAMASIEKADFYLVCGDPVLAERFYKVALKTFKADGWPSLEADARRRILSCQRAQAGQQRDRLLKSLLHVATSPDLPPEESMAAWSDVSTVMLDSAAEADSVGVADSPNRILRKVRLPCEPLLKPLRLTLLGDCPNRRQRALLQLHWAAPKPLDNVTVRCVAFGPGPSNSEASPKPQAESSPVRARGQPPPKPPKPLKPAKPNLLRSQPSMEQQHVSIRNSTADEALVNQEQQLPPPLERSQSRLSARSLAPGDLVLPLAAPKPNPGSPQSAADDSSDADLFDSHCVGFPTPGRCVVRYGDPKDAKQRYPLASADSSVSLNSSLDSPERFAALRTEASLAAGRPALIAGGVRLLPGENRVVLEAQTAGLLEPGELLVQCGRLVFFADASATTPSGLLGRHRRRRRLCDATWRDPALRRRLLPSLELLPPTPQPPLLLHFEHRLVVQLRPGLLDGSGGGGSQPQPELRLLPLTDSSVGESATPTGKAAIDADGCLRFSFACRAEPQPGEAWTSCGRAAIRLAVAQVPDGDAARVELRYLRPLLFSHCVHNTGSKTYLSVHLRPNEELDETLLVSNPELSWKSAKLLCNVEETLSPGCAVAYLWELPDPLSQQQQQQQQQQSAVALPSNLRLSCIAQRACDDSRAVVTYAF